MFQEGEALQSPEGYFYPAAAFRSDGGAMPWSKRSVRAACQPHMP